MKRSFQKIAYTLSAAGIVMTLPAPASYPASLLGSPSFAFAGEQSPRVADLQPMVDTLVQAYNAGDSKLFFSGFASPMKAAMTEDTFNVLYGGTYKQDYGKILKIQPLQERTSLNESVPLLAFTAETEKEKSVLLMVNFTKENGSYKVMQVQLMKNPH